ncbi:hypothetical protein CDL12_02694 [Handroanthus impetiginosus]|uniref:NAC domain-containing protein n=1 Tax=Handroanthus impetiginosus TaxID=429701 RepID=A0A2G9I483_9LAMI|nr:hypothetical protein CDL12_02694 [Handroanthus impetiginosus]
MAGITVDSVMYKEDGQLMNEEEYIRSFPLGIRFRPTDEELVGYYLTRKIKNLELPPLTRIREVDLYKFATPNDLAERYVLIKERERGWYFFTPGKSNHSGGYWKATAGDAPVYSRGHIIGQKKTLCFYQGAKLAKKTNWIMHEFRINNEIWVLCKVFERNVGSNTTTSQRATAEDFPNHATEEQQQNEEVLAAIVPAVVTNNANELQQPIILEQNQEFLESTVHPCLIMEINHYNRLIKTHLSPILT